MSTPWPAEDELRARLGARFAARTAFEWQGTTYRFASLKYSDRETFIDGIGARKAGGRFTPIYSQRTLYLSLDRATATAELDSWYAYYNVPDTAFQPRVLAAVAVSVGLLLDLENPDVLTAVGLTPEHVVEEWRLISDSGQVAPTQTLGRLIYEAGFEGIRFPSARRAGGFNLALFPDNYIEGSHALMLNMG